MYPASSPNARGGERSTEDIASLSSERFPNLPLSIPPRFARSEHLANHLTRILSRVLTEATNRGMTVEMQPNERGRMSLRFRLDGDEPKRRTR
jgi:hypothetical protein